MYIFWIALSTIILCVSVKLYTKYKPIVVFFVLMISNDVVKIWKKYKSPKTKNSKNRQCEYIRFFSKNHRYVVVIPDEILHDNFMKILAISKSSNVTEKVLEAMGPNMDFFGFKVTPRNLGIFDPVTIWKNKNMKKFGVDEILNLAI